MARRSGARFSRHGLLVCSDPWPHSSSLLSRSSLVDSWVTGLLSCATSARSSTRRRSRYGRFCWVRSEPCITLNAVRVWRSGTRSSPACRGGTEYGSRMPGRSTRTPIRGKAESGRFLTPTPSWSTTVYGVCSGSRRGARHTRSKSSPSPPKPGCARILRVMRLRRKHGFRG